MCSSEGRNPLTSVNPNPRSHSPENLVEIVCAARSDVRIQRQQVLMRIKKVFEFEDARLITGSNSRLKGMRPTEFHRRPHPRSSNNLPVNREHKLGGG